MVFVREDGGTYKAQPVETGMSDATWTEIKSGLTAGQHYVAKNSFVVKADIGKAGAEHGSISPSRGEIKLFGDAPDLPL